MMKGNFKKLWILMFIKSATFTIFSRCQRVVIFILRWMVYSTFLDQPPCCRYYLPKTSYEQACWYVEGKARILTDLMEALWKVRGERDIVNYWAVSPPRAARWRQTHWGARNNTWPVVGLVQLVIADRWPFLGHLKAASCRKKGAG
jgi:hypothetical protein